MAFDVVVAGALLGAGMPVLYVMVLLFVLGIFSCYSGFIVATTVSRKVAVSLFGVLAAMGVGAGRWTIRAEPQRGVRGCARRSG